MISNLIRVVCGLFVVIVAWPFSPASGQSGSPSDSDSITKTVYEDYQGTLQFQEFDVQVNAYSGTPEIIAPLMALPGNGNTTIDIRKTLYGATLLNGDYLAPRITGAVICEYGVVDMRDQEDEYEYDNGQVVYAGDISEHQGTYLRIPGRAPIRLSMVDSQSGGTHLASDTDYASVEFYQAFCHGSPPADHYTGDRIQEDAVTMDVVAPDGTRYIFEKDKPWEGAIHNWHIDFERGRGMLRAKQIIDVSGNTINFTYGGTNSGRSLDRVVGIDTSDGRTVTISRTDTADAADSVTTITTNGRSWVFGAAIGQQGTSISRTITRPDGSTWVYRYTGEMSRLVSQPSGACDDGPLGTISVTNPYGAELKLYFEYISVFAPDNYLRFHLGRTPTASEGACTLNAVYNASVSHHPAVVKAEITEPYSNDTYRWDVDYEIGHNIPVSQSDPDDFVLDRTISYPDGTEATYTYNSDGRSSFVGTLLKSEVRDQTGGLVMTFEPE